ncbi:MAG: arsenic resistance N-acetyltransferase ArsN2 [Gemmatimonadales bacterium]|jgi:N-acetylglutamate synthase-like GNAT family acetyltransferase
MAIRPASADDLATVAELVAGAGLPVDGLGDQFPGGYAVAEGGAGLVGVAGMERHGDFGLLRSVAVAASHRGTGLGKALVADRLLWARQARLGAVYLLTTTAADFFAALGFARTARAEAPAPIRASREFSVLCPGTSVLMRLPL